MTFIKRLWVLMVLMIMVISVSIRVAQLYNIPKDECITANELVGQMVEGILTNNTALKNDSLVTGVLIAPMLGVTVYAVLYPGIYLGFALGDVIHRNVADLDTAILIIKPFPYMLLAYAGWILLSSLWSLVPGRFKPKIRK